MVQYYSQIIIIQLNNPFGSSLMFIDHLTPDKRVHFYLAATTSIADQHLFSRADHLLFYRERTTFLLPLDLKPSCSDR